MTKPVSALLAAFALLLAHYLWLLSNVLRPLRRLVSQSTRLTQGDLSALDAPCGGSREIETVQRAMAGMVSHVRRVQDAQQRFTSNLTAGQEMERSRLARELHDETIQSLIAIARTIDLATHWIGQDDERARHFLKQARNQAVDGVDEVRRLIADLRPPALDELGLVTALRMLADKSPLEASVDVEGHERRIDEQHELTLFRAAQEALTNAQKHARATRVGLRVAFAPGEVRLTIEDDGIGLELPEHLEDLAAQGHFGLVGILERTRALGGAMQVTSQPGAGSRLAVVVPVKAGQQPMGLVRDPVCCAELQPQEAFSSMEFEDTRYYFCCPVCEGTFRGDPRAYVESRH